MELIYLNLNFHLKMKVWDVGFTAPRKQCPSFSSMCSFCLLPFFFIKAFVYSFIHTLFLGGVLLVERKADTLRTGPDESNMVTGSEEIVVERTREVCIWFYAHNQGRCSRWKRVSEFPGPEPGVGAYDGVCMCACLFVHLPIVCTKP